MLDHCVKVSIAEAVIMNAVSTVAQLMSDNDEGHDPPGMHTKSRRADQNSAELPAGGDRGAGKSSQQIRAFETL